MNSQCFEHLYPSNQTPLHSQCFKRSIAQAHGNVRRQQSNISSEGESQGGGRVPTCCYVSKKIMHWCRRSGNVQKSSTLLDLCVPSLRRGHANLLCIVPILTDVPRKDSICFFKNSYFCLLSYDNWLIWCVWTTTTLVPVME